MLLWRDSREAEREEGGGGRGGLRRRRRWRAAEAAEEVAWEKEKSLVRGFERDMVTGETGKAVQKERF